MRTSDDERRTSPGPDARRWRALTVSLVGAFMVLLDVSIVNVTLPSIEREFGVSAGTVQWVVSGYALTFGLALVPAGRLGDTIGRRRMFLISLSAFAAGCSHPPAGFCTRSAAIVGHVSVMTRPRPRVSAAQPVGTERPQGRPRQAPGGFAPPASRPAPLPSTSAD